MHASACINHPLHLSLLLARSCLPLYQRRSLKAGTPSIFTDLKFLRLSPPQLLKKTSPCSPLHIHTYINTSLWRQEAEAPGQEGAKDKNHLEFKAEDCGSLAGRWTVRQSHRLKLTLLWHTNHQTGRSRCVCKVPSAMRRIWSGEVLGKL